MDDRSKRDGNLVEGSQCEQQRRQQQRENNDTAKSLNSDLEKRTRRFEGGSDSR
jgi:hypothetical protein